MAIDKMVDSAKLDREMLATANAIRERGKTEAEIPWENETGFEQAVLAIKGGVELNFEVVGGETEPVDPAENTIWVNTLNEITSWIFSEEEPESPEPGMVWFGTGTNNTVEFNALKENAIQLCPVKAKQYVSEEWVSKPVYSYHSGEWVQWVLTIVPNSGYNWVNYGSANTPTITVNSDGSIRMYAGTTGEVHAVVGTSTPIDMTGFDTMKVTFTATDISNQNARIGLSKTKGAGTSNIINYFLIKDYPANTKVTVPVPLDGIDVPVYVIAALFNHTVTIHNITLE